MPLNEGEQRYLARMAEIQFPTMQPEPAGTVRPGAMQGEMKAIEQTLPQKAMGGLGVALERAGQMLDKGQATELGRIFEVIDQWVPGTLNEITGKEIPVIGELRLRDLMPFVGGTEQVEDPLTGKITTKEVGTPQALQMAGRGESLTTGTGFTTKMKPDVTAAAMEVGLGVAPLAKTVAPAIGKQITKATKVSAAKANQSLAKRMTDDWENLTFEYAQLPESKNGQVLNTDVARELSPDYWKDRTRSADVHEAASAVVKKLYTDKLSKPTPEGKESIVIFSAGGTGAGKSTGLKSTGLLPEWEKELGPELQRAEIIYDTNMNTLESAIKKIDQALESGRDVGILYTFRDPIDALSEGALKRATHQEEKFGTGRTVPIAEHIKTHIGARDTIPKLAEHYKDNPRVVIEVIDNSRGKGNQVVTTLDQLPEVGDKISLERQAYGIAKQQYDAGNISEATFRGTTEGLSKRATATAAGKNAPNNERANRRGSKQSARGNDKQVSRAAASTDKGAQ